VQPVKSLNTAQQYIRNGFRVCDTIFPSQRHGLASDSQVSQAKQNLFCSIELAKSSCMTCKADWVPGCQPPQPCSARNLAHPRDWPALQNCVSSPLKKTILVLRKNLVSCLYFVPHQYHSSSIHLESDRSKFPTRLGAWRGLKLPIQRFLQHLRA